MTLGADWRPEIILDNSTPLPAMSGCFPHLGIASLCLYPDSMVQDERNVEQKEAFEEQTRLKADLDKSRKDYKLLEEQKVQVEQEAFMKQTQLGAEINTAQAKLTAGARWSGGDQGLSGRIEQPILQISIGLGLQFYQEWLGPLPLQ